MNFNSNKNSGSSPVYEKRLFESTGNINLLIWSCFEVLGKMCNINTYGFWEHKSENVSTWEAFTQLSWAALRCSLCLARSEAVIGAAQDLLLLIESSTDDKTSWSLVHTTLPPPSENKH